MTLLKSPVRDRPKLRLIIAGDPEDSFEPYQAQIRRLGITGITQAHPRFVSEQFKSTLYAAADVAIMPHRESSQSGMGLEALAAGKPIVVTRVGGLVELVDEEVNGYSVPVSDPMPWLEPLHGFSACRVRHRMRWRPQVEHWAETALPGRRLHNRHVALYRRIAEEKTLAEKRIQ